VSHHWHGLVCWRTELDPLHAEHAINFDCGAVTFDACACRRRSGFLLIMTGGLVEGLEATPGCQTIHEIHIATKLCLNIQP
jgi:hypothetical protein